MPGLTFGGKPAAAVSTRHHTLPLLDPAIEAQRDQRRTAEADRRDRHTRAAEWRGKQIAYHAERVRRLEPIRIRLGRWLDAHHWKDDRWQHRNRRYWTVAAAIRAHERVIHGAITKVDELVRSKPMKQQEAITAASFAARNGPVPTWAELGEMAVGR